MDYSQVQILVAFKEKVNYYKCENFKPIENVTFKRILNKPIDFLGYEKMATPFLYDSIKKYAEEVDTEPENIRIYILKTNENILLAVYNVSDLIIKIPLEEHFSKMGIK